jgi:hypothetical protein
MAKKNDIQYGTCQNPECMNFGIPDQIPADGNCPMCHKPMKAEEETATDSSDMGIDGLDGLSTDTIRSKKDTNWKKIALITGIVIGILIIAGAITLLLKKGSPKLETLTLDKSDVILRVGDTDTLTALFTEADAEATLIWKVSKGGVISVDNGIVTALQEGEGKVLLKVAENDELKAICKYTVEKAEKAETSKPIKGIQRPNPRPVDPPYVKSEIERFGVYTGSRKNGIPDGTGKVTFSKSYQLNSEYTAQPGEYIQGIFENGKPTFVTYYQKDGTVTKIKLR